MSPLSVLGVFCALVVGASLLGGWLPGVVRLTHTRMQVTVSFVGGFMLGVSLFHMLPHAAASVGDLDRVMAFVVLGLLVMFFLLRAFQFHHHEPLGGHGHESPRPAASSLGWVGVAIGLAIHTAIDGVALASSVAAEAREESSFRLWGLGAFIAILLHKPLDALAITSLMTAGGWSSRLRTLVNAGFALMCPLGALLFYLGVGTGSGDVVGCALAFSAGVFLCISLGDLLPEIQFHRHDRVKLTVALVLGVACAYAIGLVEAHPHDFGEHAH